VLYTGHVKEPEDSIENKKAIALVSLYHASRFLGCPISPKFTETDVN